MRLTQSAEDILDFYDNGGSLFASCGYNMGGLSAGWHHVAAVCDNTKVDYYVDDALVGTVPVVPPSEIAHIVNIDSGMQHFADAIDDMRVYSRAFSASEVQAVYDAGQ